jgi:predicted ATPase with chaperone activity
VARTLADLEGSETIGEAHVAEAVQYRGWEHASRS